MEQNIAGSVSVRAIVVGVVVTLVVVTGWYFSSVQKPGSSPSVEGKAGGVVVKGKDTFRPDNEKALATVEGGTREQISANVKTPEPGDKPSDSNIAVPSSVSGNGPKFRVFSITASGGKFTPSTIVVNAGDVIDLTVAATDGDYDVVFRDLGVYKLIKSGTAGKIQFQAYPYGEYSFGCDSVCKGGSGKLIVNPRQ